MCPPEICNMKNRKPNRLANYDYSQNGLYFITICTQNKKHYFGEITNDAMHSNIAGKIADKWWQKLEEKFDITLHEYVIMPNHIHGIIEINNPQHSAWTNSQYNVGTPLVGVRHNATANFTKRTPTRGVPTVSDIIGAYKSYTTNEYIKEVKSGVLPPFDKRIWQRSFYDHIIRKNESLNKIREYIIINPQEWNNDEFNTLNTHKSIRT